MKQCKDCPEFVDKGGEDIWCGATLWRLHRESKGCKSFLRGDKYPSPMNDEPKRKISTCLTKREWNKYPNWLNPHKYHLFTDRKSPKIKLLDESMRKKRARIRESRRKFT